MNLVLGIDLGTSYFKVGAFDKTGAMLGLSRQAVGAESGASSEREPTLKQEISPIRFVSLIRDGIRDALAESRADAQDICGISYSSQANSFLLLDNHAEPTTPLILWSDRRADAIPKSLDALYANPAFLATTGMDVCSPLGAVAKVDWLKTHMPECWKQAQWFMTISDYLVWLLTGERNGDAGTASLLGLWDLRNESWWPTALDAAGIPARMLSWPLRPGTAIGATSTDSARLLGIPAGIPVAAGSLDHHMAAFGAGVGTVADCSESTGTVLACLRPRDAFGPTEGCVSGPGMAGQKPYYSLAFYDAGAVVLDWYRSTHAPECSFDDLTALASGIAPGADGLMARPSAHHQPGLDGFIGADQTHPKGAYVRAILESTAAILEKLLHRLEGDDGGQLVVSTGGGARSDLWLQIKADVIGRPFVATASPEPACYGAAMLAAHVAGWYADPTSVSNAWVKPRVTIGPDPGRHSIYTEWLKQYARILEEDHEIS